MPWSTYGDAAATYGSAGNGFGSSSGVPARLYGDSTYGDGNYGESAAFSQVGAIQGPRGDSDLAYLPIVESQLSYPSGWGPYPGFQEPRAFRDRQGFCHLSGVFVGPTSFAAGAVAAYLPFGFWPRNRVMHPCYTGNPMNQARLDINQDGGLAINSTQPAGVSYMICHMMWATTFPSVYVIDGLYTTVAITGRGSGNLGWITVKWTAGHILDSYTTAGVATVRAVPAGSVTILSNLAGTTNWGFAIMQPGATPAPTISSASYASETAALQDWQTVPNTAILCSFQFSALPTVYDRRWLAYAAGPVLV